MFLDKLIDVTEYRNFIVISLIEVTIVCCWCLSYTVKSIFLWPWLIVIN